MCLFFFRGPSFCSTVILKSSYQLEIQKVIAKSAQTGPKRFFLLPSEQLPFLQQGHFIPNKHDINGGRGKGALVPRFQLICPIFYILTVFTYSLLCVNYLTGHAFVHTQHLALYASFDMLTVAMDAIAACYPERHVLMCHKIPDFEGIGASWMDTWGHPGWTHGGILVNTWGHPGGAKCN